MQLLSRELVMEKLREVQDPELMMSVVDLGLIYDVTIEEGRVHVLYTLTSPGCPLAPVISGQIEHALMDIPGVKQVDAQLHLQPPLGPPHHGQRRRQDAARHLVGLTPGTIVVVI